MEENKISVVINTYNASKYLAQVLESVKDFDEILICDMESTDDTLNIARQYECNVITFPKEGHTIVEPARQYAINHTRYDWVLVVDADELVTPELRNYLYTCIKGRNPPSGIFIPRKNYFMGHFMRCFYPDHILRFLKKDGANWPVEVHSIPTVAGRVEKLPAAHKELAFEHLANDTLLARIKKTNLYTEGELQRKTKKYGVMALLWRPFFRFFKAYILKGGFRDGIPGLICAGYEGLYQFVIVSKMMERRYRKEL